MKKIKYKQIIAFLFFIFFTTPILSPSIMGNTIYIHWFIPLLDLKFVKSVMNLQIKKAYFYSILVVILVMLLLGELITIIKFLFLIETVLYLFYCKKNNMFHYLYWSININIIIGITQFILYYISPTMAYMIGPTNIARIIWGNNATKTFTNFYPIYKIVRVSGWSREAGFFASLIEITSIIYIIDKEQKKSILQYVFLGIGYLISFSKSSLLLIVLLGIVLLEKKVSKIPYYITVILIILSLIGVSNYLEQKGFYTKENESIIHRISGYSIIEDLNFEELLLGTKNMKNINESALEKHNYLKYVYKYNEFCGIPNLIINHGLIVAFIFIIALRKVGFTTAEFLLLTIGTLTVNYFTATSFVVLIYYLCIDMINKRRNCNKIESNKEIIIE